MSGQKYLEVLKKYTVFNGRARRSEYWYFVLFNLIISIGLGIIDGVVGLMDFGISDVYSLGVLVPSIAVGVRRMHDVGKSGWMYFVVLIPIIGAIWLLVLFFTDSQLGSNKWGENPKEIVS